MSNAEAKIRLQPEKTQVSSKSISTEPRKKLQKVNSPEKMEEIDSEEEPQLQSQQADSSLLKKRFQQSETIVTSKDTEARGGLNLATKRATTNKGGPGSSRVPKTQAEVVLEKVEKKEDRTRSPKKGCDGSQGAGHKRRRWSEDNANQFKTEERAKEETEAKGPFH